MSSNSMFKSVTSHWVRLPAILTILFITAGSSLFNSGCGASNNTMDIVVYSDKQLIPEINNPFRVVALNRQTGEPIANADIRISIIKNGERREIQLFEGKTKANGSPAINLNLPKGLSGGCHMKIDIRSSLGKQSITVPVNITGNLDMLLNTDRTTYRPGQVIHIRCLLFKAASTAAKHHIRFQVFEAGGNQVFEQEQETCVFGIANASFTLGDAINTGSYKIRATAGNNNKEVTVRVSAEAPPGLITTCQQPTGPYPAGTTPVQVGNKTNKDLTLHLSGTRCHAGETVELTISSLRKQGNVYIDLFENNRFILTSDAALLNGVASIRLPVPGKYPATLSCFAWTTADTGTLGKPVPLLWDMKTIIRLPARSDAIKVKMEADKDNYTHGETARIKIHTTNQGNPLATAVGIHIDDGFHTLYTNPRLITDGNGRASFTIKTTSPAFRSKWRIFAFAHTFNGKTGKENRLLPVDRGITAAIDLPPRLIQGDEINVPVYLYNDRPVSQDLTLTLKNVNGFQFNGASTQHAVVRPKNIKTAYYKIKARTPGNHRLTFRLSGSGSPREIEKNVSVLPDGKKIQETSNHKLKAGKEIKKRIYLPETAINDSDTLTLKIYPGLFSHMLEGMESMLRMPTGCFEQSTSATYPDVLVLNYLEKSGRATPAINAKAKKFISKGYQKLLGFQTPEGGFSTYGGKNLRVLTAFGLILFADMEQVYPIDKKIIPRIQKVLLSQMKKNYWEPDSHFGAASSARDNTFTATAYITWALLHSGLDKDNGKIKKAMRYLEKNYIQHLSNPTALSYCALSLHLAKRDPVPVLEELNRLAINDQNGIYWTLSPGTAGGNTYSASSIETTAIAALANLKTRHRDLDTMQILHFLLKHKTGAGHWGSTQTTALALKVLIEALPQSFEQVFGKADIWLDKHHIKQIIFTEDNTENMHVIDLKPFVMGTSSKLRVTFKGRGELFYQLLSSYYLKWDDPSLYRGRSNIDLNLVYDTLRLNRGENLTADLTARYTGKGLVRFPIIDMGIPPGFKVGCRDLDKIQANGLIQHYEINGDRLILYLSDLDKKGRQFQLGLLAATKVHAFTPETRIYDYYNPGLRDSIRPVKLEVE